MNYEVTITAWTTVVVIDAANEEKAMEAAFDQISTWDWEGTDAKADVIADEDLETAKRHANHISLP